MGSLLSAVFKNRRHLHGKGGGREGRITGCLAQHGDKGVWDSTKILSIKQGQGRLPSVSSTAVDRGEYMSPS